MFSPTSVALSLFRNIEMPLLVSVSDAEYTGIPVSLPFFAKLKQDLSVRIRYDKSYIHYYFSSKAHCVADNPPYCTPSHRVIEGFFREIGGLNPASPQEMTALKRRLTEERRAALTAHWEAFASTYDFPLRKGTDKSRTVFDGPYRGVGMSVEPHLSSWQDDHQSSKKGQYPGQYLQQYRGQATGDGLPHGQSTGVLKDKVPYGSAQSTVRTQYPRHNDARTGHQPYSNPALTPQTPSEVQVPIRGVSAWNQEGAVSPYPPLPSSSSGCGALHHTHHITHTSSHTPHHTHLITHTSSNTPHHTHLITHTSSHTPHRTDYITETA
jgi:hypothetical protein